MTRIWKKILIIMCVCSLVTYTVIPPKKAEASVIGYTTLAALAASMPALAPVAIVGVACALMLGLTITNFDEIVELGQRVVDSMSKKGYRIQDYVNDLAYTMIINAALKQTIQEVAGNLPDYIPYIENRLDELITIPIDYSKVNYWTDHYYGSWGAFLFTFNNSEGITFTQNQQIALNITFQEPITQYRRTVYDFGDGYPFVDENIHLIPGVYRDREGDWIESSSTARLNSTPILNNVGHLVGYDIIIVPQTWGDELAHVDGIAAYSPSIQFATTAQPITNIIDYPATAVSFDKTRALSPSQVGTLTDTLFPNTTTISVNKDMTLTGKNIHSLDEIMDIEKTPTITSAISQAGISVPHNAGLGNETGGGSIDIGGILGILQAILAAIIGLGQVIVDGILSGFSWLQALLNNIWQAILSIPGATAIAAAIGNTFGWLQGAMVGVIEGIAGLPILIASAIKVSFHWLQGLLNDIWQGILSIPGATAIATAIGHTFGWLQGAMISMVDSILGLPALIASAVKASFFWLQGLLNDIWQAILSIPGASVIAVAIATAFSWLESSLISIGEGILSLPGTIASAIGLTFSWLQNLLINIWDGITALPGAIGGILSDTFSWLKGLLTNIWQTAIAVPGDIYNVLVDVFKLIFTLDQDWLNNQLQILVAELALKIPTLPNVVEMVAYKGDQDEWAGLYANFDHYGIGRQKVVDNHAPNYFRHTTKIIIRGFLYFLLALFFIRKIYIFADD